MKPVVVIGGTGLVGRHVVAQLAERGVPIRVVSRNPGPSGVRGDLTVPQTLDAGLSGADAVFLVWTSPAATIARAIERIGAHARRVVFLSAPLKTPHPFVQQPNPLRAVTEEVERTIESSGLEWTFLRPGMFAGNAVRWWAPAIRSGDVVRWPYLSVPTAPIDERDIAAVGVRALCEDGHAGAEYVLTGQGPLTQFEQLSIIGRAIGRPLRVEEMSPEEARLAKFPDFLLNAWRAALGLPAFVSPTFEDLMGRPPRSFQQWAADHAAEFRG